MDIELQQGGISYKLNGAGVTAPVRGARASFSPATPTGAPGAAATLEIAMDGTAAQIGTFQGYLETVLYLSELYFGLPGEAGGYLQVTLPDSSAWISPVVSGRISGLGAGAAGRAAGSEGIRMDLVLAPYWESTTTTDCPLSNKYGTNVTNGIQVDNHDDAGHDSFVNLVAGVLGDVPAPAILTVTSATQNMEFLIGQAVNPSPALNITLEGESLTNLASTTVTPTADGAGCSNGNYGALGWNGSGVGGSYWLLDVSNSGYFGGRMYRPVLRLRDLVAGGEKIWAHFGLSAAIWTWVETYSGDGVLLPTDSRLVVFPPMPVPACGKGPIGFAWDANFISLLYQAESGGAHAMNVDFVQLVPCDGWIRFYSLYSGVATQVRYDCGTGQLTRSGTVAATHVPDGPGLLLYPGVYQRFYFLGQAAPLADIAYNITLKLQYKARKRVL